MSNNAQTLDDLRYCAENFVFHLDEVEANLREFAASLIGAGISSPAQKPTAEALAVPAVGLVGNPFCALHSAGARSIPCELPCFECATAHLKRP